MPESELIIVAGAALALICLIFAIRSAWRQRLIDNTPTCKTAGIFIGIAELKGTAESVAPLRSYLAEAQCVYYLWRIEEHWSRTVTETYRDSKGNTQTRTRHESGWETVAEDGKMQTFYLEDSTGVVLVRPEGAKMEGITIFEHECRPGDPIYYGKGPDGSVSNSDHRRKFTEQAIPLHSRIYIFGKARERQDIVAPEIAKSADAPMYLISTRTEKQISGGYKLGYWLLAICGLIFSVAGVIVAKHVENAVLENHIGDFIFAGGAFIAAWMIAWVWMVFNSLTELRNRVRQAWSNVDVQLKRRADLIPNLISVVSQYKDYEATVQEEIAFLRSQLQSTAPGRPGPDPMGCSGKLRAIAEKYPDLKASDNFLRLQRELANTEQRIALARTFFNEIATFFNTRLAVVPECIVASLGRLKPQPLITAEDFERAAVEVKLAK